MQSAKHRPTRMHNASCMCLLIHHRQHMLPAALPPVFKGQSTQVTQLCKRRCLLVIKLKRIMVMNNARQVNAVLDKVRKGVIAIAQGQHAHTHSKDGRGSGMLRTVVPKTRQVRTQTYNPHKRANHQTTLPAANIPTDPHRLPSWACI